MARDPLSPSANPCLDSDPEEDEFEEEDGDEQVAADAETGANSDEDDDDDDDAEEEEEVELQPAEEEDESSEKTDSPVPRLDYGSDADSGQSMPSPSPSDYVVKENLGIKKKRAAESEPLNEKSELKKSNKEKKKGEKEKVVAAVVGENVVSEDKAKRSAGQRIWGPEDELMIVKGMMDFKEKNGVDFNSNLDAFYQFIKGQLNAVVDKSQLVNKIRKLKEKFRDNAAKEGNGGELVFSKTHEAKVYEYSKKVWGGKAVARSKSKSKKEKEVVVDAPQTAMEVDNVLALPVPDIELSKKEVNDGSDNDGDKSASRVQKEVNGGVDKSAIRMQKEVKKTKEVQKMVVDDNIKMNDSVIPMPVMVDTLMFQKGLEFVEKSKLDALNEKWIKYQMDAAELYLRRLDLIKEQTELILDAMKSNP